MRHHIAQEPPNDTRVPLAVTPGRRHALQQLFYRSLLLRTADALLHQQVGSTLAELERFQWLPIDEIDRHRARRLTDLVTFGATHVPFYREALRERGVHPSDIRQPGDLPLLPVLTRQDLQERFEALKVEGYSGAAYLMHSSGSTGAQTSVLVDRSCDSEVFATQLLFWSWGGFSIGQPHLQTGMSVNRGWVKRIKDLLLRCSYVSAFDLTDAAAASILERIDRRGIRALFGYASSLYVLARYLEQRGLTRSMACIFTWGDSLFPHYRALIERVFQCPVNDCYGLGEGLQCAAQCESHDALHEAMHGVVLEIVDHAGAPVPEGQLGRVVVTRLIAGPMPLIRYDTGDVAHFVPGPCPCGRALRRISRIQGRASDIVTTPSGDRLIVHVFTQLFEMIPAISQFQVHQDTPEAIVILYVRGRDFDDAILERIRRDIVSHCRYPLGIEFREVSAIPLERSNKRRFVISRVPF